MKHRVAFSFVFLVVQLHLLRNTSALGYIALYMLAAFVSVLGMRSNSHRRPWANEMVLWFAAPVVALITSLAFISPSGAATGLIRFLFAAPVFFALRSYTRDLADLRIYVSLVVIWGLLASATVPMQILLGPVEWFAEASLRGEYTRYASLLGSLTSLGTVIGAYLLLSAGLARKSWQIFVLIALALIGAVSLSKAAIVNVMLGLLVLLWMERRKFLVPAAVLLLAGGALVPWLMTTEAFGGRLDTSLVSFGLNASDGGVRNYDVGLLEGATDRVTVLPMETLHNLVDLGHPLAWFTGAGFGMASTALVPAADALSPMAHNQYVESVAVFGLIMAAAQVWVMCRAFAQLGRLRVLDPLFVYLQAGLALLMLNAVFVNGILYQPASASLLYLFMFAAFSLPRTFYAADGDMSLAVRTVDSFG